MIANIITIGGFGDRGRGASRGRGGDRGRGARLYTHLI
jgi:hypothetical protein